MSSDVVSLYLDFAIAGRQPDDATAILAAVLDAVPIASLLIRSGGNEPLDLAAARPLISLAQKKGVAALLLADAASASKIGADGVHLPWSRDVVRQFKDQRQSARTGSLIGADAGRTRHDAMELAEAGADYVAFGIPPHVEDRDRAAERQIDLVSWWGPVFEIPCVAFDVADAELAQSLAEAGADFVAVTLTSQHTIADALAHVRIFSEAVQIRERAK